MPYSDIGRTGVAINKKILAVQHPPNMESSQNHTDVCIVCGVCCVCSVCGVCVLCVLCVCVECVVCVWSCVLLCSD